MWKFKIQTLFALSFYKTNSMNSIFYATSYVLVPYNFNFVSANVFWRNDSQQTFVVSS